MSVEHKHVVRPEAHPDRFAGLEFGNVRSGTAISTSFSPSTRNGHDGRSGADDLAYIGVYDRDDAVLVGLEVRIVYLVLRLAQRRSRGVSRRDRLIVKKGRLIELSLGGKRFAEELFGPEFRKAVVRTCFFGGKQVCLCARDRKADSRWRRYGRECHPA